MENSIKVLIDKYGRDSPPFMNDGNVNTLYSWMIYQKVKKSKRKLSQAEINVLDDVGAVKGKTDK